MAAQSIWRVLRQFLTPKTKKNRDWKRICLIASFSGAGASFAGLAVPTIFGINQLSYVLGSFTFAEEYQETVRSRSTEFFSISISLFVLIVAQAVYFFIFWPGYEYTVIRTCAILVFVLINLGLAWTQFTPLDGILTAPIDPSKSRHYPARVTDGQIQERYDHLVR